MRTAVVGIGRWGKNIARELNAESTLVAYCTRSDVHDAWAAEDIPQARRMKAEDVWADTTIEAVAIATPIDTHAALVRVALEAGKHVFVEKPLALTAGEAEALAELASAKKRTLAVGYIFLHHPAFQEMEKSTRLESIHSVALDWQKYGTFDESIEYNLLTHHLALSLAFAGEPQRVEVVARAAEETACDVMETHLMYETFVLLSRINRIAQEKKHTMTVELKDGSVHTYVFDARKEPLALEMKAFLQAAGGDPGALLSDGAFAVKVLSLHEKLTAPPR